MGLMPKQPKRPVPGTANLSTQGLIKKPAGKPVFLESKDFILRTLKLSDAGPTFSSWFNDPVVLAGLNLPEGGISRENLRGYISEYDNQKKYMIGIFTKPEQRFVGYYVMDINLEHRVGTLSVVIGDRDIRVGASGNRLDRVICKEFFDNRKVEKIVARVLATNFRAIWMMKQTDFELEGLMKKDNRLPDGGRVDILQFCLFPDDLK